MDKIKRLLEFSANLIVALAILLAPTIANAIMIPLLGLSVWNVVVEGLPRSACFPPSGCSSQGCSGICSTKSSIQKKRNRKGRLTAWGRRKKTSENRLRTHSAAA